MKLKNLANIIFFLMLICNQNFIFASSPYEMTLVGEVISFNKTHVRIRSGKQEYIFLMEELDHPHYVIGQKIEIPFEENKIKQALVKKMKTGR